MGAPEVSLLICRPVCTAIPAAGIYHIHGGGMIMGDNRFGLLNVLEWTEELQLAVDWASRIMPRTRRAGQPC